MKGQGREFREVYVGHDYVRVGTTGSNTGRPVTTWWQDHCTPGSHWTVSWTGEAEAGGGVCGAGRVECGLVLSWANYVSSAGGVVTRVP